MRGVVRGEGTPVVFNYEQGLESDSLTAVIDDEVFSGRAVMANASTTVGNVFGTAYSSDGFTSGTGTIFGSTTTNSFVTTMLGSRGGSLQCQLQYARSLGETSSGGVGVCQHSDGHILRGADSGQLLIETLW